MLSVSTNTSAMTAHRFLNANSSEASSSIAKMSSGTRLVKASDDASSLAISNKLSSDLAALNQASANASQGASLIQIATGGLDQVSDILTRMKTLSTQVVNGTLSTSERQFAQQEFGELINQIDAVSQQTKVNGYAMLNGGSKTMTVSDKQTAVGGAVTAGSSTLTASAHFAVGAVSNLAGQVEGEVSDVTAVDIGGQTQLDITIGGETFRGVVDETAAVATEIEFRGLSNDANSFTLTTATGALVDAATTEAELENLFNMTSATVPIATFQSAEGTEATSAALLNTTQTTFANTVDASNNVADGTYTVTSSFSAGDAATGEAESLTFRIQDEDGNVYEASVADESGTVADSTLRAATDTVNLTFSNGITLNMDGAAINAAAAADLAGVRFQVNGGDSSSLTFQVGAEVSDTIDLTFDSVSSADLGLAGANIETVAGAQSASLAIDQAINSVNTSTARLGAQQSRMEYIQSNLATISENLEAANGVYKDVDMAAEMTKFTQSQTLMQAGISMLSQANQMPQLLARLIQ